MKKILNFIRLKRDTSPDEGVSITAKQQPFVSSIEPCVKLNLPSSFMIAGIPVKVYLDPKLFEREGCIGKTNYAEQSITLDPTLTYAETIEQTFLHEVCHWIFHIIGREDINDDDPLIDMMAHLLYQVMSTEKGRL
jgi:hypothetical protein